MHILDMFEDILESVPTDLMELKPSEYAEKYRRLTSSVSSLATGKFKYDLVPYLREIVDTLSPYHPAKIIGVKKGAQIGFTEGVIVNGILWIIYNNPGNTLALSANDQLSKEMVESRLDQGIASCGIQDLIRPNTIRKRNQRTGDTSQYKEFAGGRLFAGSLQAINKLSKQRSIKYGFFDDWEAAPISDKDQGNVFELLQQRFSTAATTMKQYYSSTPETKPSNIDRVYEMGDQRKWFVPCPECGTYIELLWQEKKEGERVGIVFDKDDQGRLIEKSVGYVCQECSAFFEEKHKYDVNLHGKWVPTAEPSRPGFYSYHLPAYIGAPGMYSWVDYAYKWLECFKDGVTSKSKLKVFYNLVKGEPWEETGERIKQNQLAKNVRKYQRGVIPNKTSQDDGNGLIILLTCACDLNGLEDDARLDWEIVAHTETGSTYSIDHGSIGTFQRGKQTEERQKWTYRNNQPYNVWDDFLEIINKDYHTEDQGTMNILFSGVDAGYFSGYAYTFMDANRVNVIGLKGKVSDRYQKINRDLPEFKRSYDRDNLYILEVDRIKDRLAEYINQPLKSPQIPGFMNFPEPSGGRYTVPGFFQQFESEEKKLEENDDGEVTGWKWVKKNAHVQNHFWDVRIYNLAMRDIIAKEICKSYKLSGWSWNQYCEIVKKVISD
jgi:phage terminase large subunit GpA-like protein